MRSFRAAFFLASLPYLLVHWRGGFWGFPAEEWDPILAFRLLGLPPVSAWSQWLAYPALAAAIVISALGKGGRAAQASAFLLALWVFGSRYNYGVELSQVDAPLVLGFFLLACAGNTEARPALRALLALVIFSAGAFKLARFGPGWLLDDPFRVFLEIRHGEAPAPGAAAFLLARPWLTAAASVATLALELTFPLALFARQSISFIYICLLAAFLAGSYLLLGHPFLLSLLPFFLAFAPPRWLKIFERCSR